MDKVFTYLRAWITATIAILFIGCGKSYYYYVSHNIDCNNCGSVIDGNLMFEIGKYYKDSDYIEIVIKNISNQTIIFNLPLFAMNQNGIVIHTPIGFDNPYVSHTYSNSSVLQKGIETPYYYDPLYNDFKKYHYLGGITTSKSTTYSPKDIMILPANTSVVYQVINFIEHKYWGYRNIYRIFKMYWMIDYDAISLKFGEVDENSTIILHLVYKKLNEDKWQTAELEYKPYSIKIDRVQVK